MISIKLKNKKENIEKIFWDWFYKYHLKEFLEILSNDVVLQNLIFGHEGKYLIWENDIYKYKKNDYAVLKKFFFSSPEEHFKYCKKMKKKNMKINNDSETFFYHRYENFRKTQIPKIIEILGIHTCPYCNRNFIDVYYDKKSTKPNKFNGDIDHYFPKSKYSYLALCLYNLIPSCKTCNHEKADLDKINFQPFHPYMDDDSTYRFKTDFDLESEITDFDYLYGLSEKFNIKISDYLGGNKANSIEESISTFHLDDKYKNMTLFAKNIIRKAYIYNNDYLKDFISQCKNILTKEEVIKILFDYDGENFLDKPLSKFKSDLMKEFDVI
ncbi:MULTISPECIES: HNH endonuclease [Clostridium]|uniref:HNH endonuclease n=1 Tax=Clostridium TaxID=1485 RepID=UPI000825D56B|nr:MULTISPECIES: hypothetical protein [Clostridium]PJI10050.1 hypothetical protein CUB90_20210 [Clostridium sp. CT7]